MYDKQMKTSLPNISILIVLLSCFAYNFYLKNWEKQDKVIEGDMHSYYAYLPAYFIYNDIKLENSEYKFENDYHLFFPRQNEKGEKVIDKTMGISILYAPF